ncbi:MAG TPA: DoxX family protein [Candidatus Angelobacter sp.]|nr:DoxX family protein [Candidatus Angelobacter sp.]
MSKGKLIALWVVSGLLAALFLFAGGMKLLMPAQVKPMFVQYGYAAWFATFIGVCETLGGIGLLIPRLAALAAGCLSVIMVGAFYTLASHHEYNQVATPLVVLVLLIVVCYARVKAARGSAPARALSQSN